MKTERLTNVPPGEPGDFYYDHLKLPYATQESTELPHTPDATIAELMDVASDDGAQLGFVILRDDHAIEIVDTVTGEHARVRLGERGRDIPRERLTEALSEAALAESKVLSVGVAETIAYLQKQDHVSALGIFQGLGERFRFVGTVLEAAVRLPRK